MTRTTANLKHDMLAELVDKTVGIGHNIGASDAEIAAAFTVGVGEAFRLEVRAKSVKKEPRPDNGHGTASLANGQMQFGI